MLQVIYCRLTDRQQASNCFLTLFSSKIIFSIVYSILYNIVLIFSVLTENKQNRFFKIKDIHKSKTKIILVTDVIEKSVTTILV